MGVVYQIEETGDESARGGLVATECEQRYDIVAQGGTGTFDEANRAFRGWLAKNAPTRNRLVLDKKDGVEIEEEPESLGRVWRGRATYRSKTAQETVDGAAVKFGAFVSSFTTAGGTARIKRSLATAAYPIAGTAPNYCGGIGWNGEEFDGCDVTTPNFAFEITANTPRGAFEDFGALADRVANYQGTVNSRPFCGFAPGVVLYTGISSGALQSQPATETEDEFFYWRATHTFLASPNREIDVEGVKVWKPGWAYFWTLTQKSFDPTTGEIVPVIRAAYVETVYRSTDFAELGLGYGD